MRGKRRAGSGHDTRRSLGDELTIGGTLAEQEVPALCGEGFRSIIDLRGSSGRGTGIAPEHEKRLAEAAGLAYEHIPMGGSPVDGSRINDLRVALWAAEPPVLMHCSDGGLAALCAMIHLGCQSGWTIDQCLDFAREHGIDFAAMPVLRAFLDEYLQRNSRAYIGCSDREASSRCYRT
jgi:uncharacterized protein (TIGR01244 family)